MWSGGRAIGVTSLSPPTYYYKERPIFDKQKIKKEKHKQNNLFEHKKICNFFLASKEKKMLYYCILFVMK